MARRLDRSAPSVRRFDDRPPPRAREFRLLDEELGGDEALDRDEDQASDDEHPEIDAPGLVGSLMWKLSEGERWVLGPDSAFVFRDCWRQMLVREAYMLERPVSREQKRREALLTAWRRWITGEPFLFDLYVAEKEGALLGISSDEIGGNLYEVAVDRGALVCRKAVYFGSDPDAILRVASPLAGLRRDMPRHERWDILKRAAYGPGWVFQRFTAREGTSPRLILQIDGDIYFRELEDEETLRTDPRHAYAWDETVSYRLVKFGNIGDRLLRGSVPFQVEFEGPGRVWLSNISFGDGYLGSVFTPSHWLFRIQEAVRNVLGYLNPANWF